MVAPAGGAVTSGVEVQYCPVLSVHKDSPGCQETKQTVNRSGVIIGDTHRRKSESEQMSSRALLVAVEGET